jgi:hypothetical protein
VRVSDGTKWTRKELSQSIWYSVLSNMSTQHSSHIFACICAKIFSDTSLNPKHLEASLCHPKFQPPARTIFTQVTALRSSDAAVPQRHVVEPAGIGTHMLGVNSVVPKKK